MTTENFVNNAIKLLQEDFGLTYEQANAMAELTVLLDKHNLQREFFYIVYHNKNDFGAL